MCSRLLVWGGLVLTGVAFSAEKKPVTLDAISAERKGAGEKFSSPEWAPGGKQFAYRKGSKLMLYDAGARSEWELVDFDALEKAAVKPPASGRFGWQNRRVSDEPLNNVLNLLLRRFFLHGNYHGCFLSVPFSIESALPRPDASSSFCSARITSIMRS